MKKTNAIFEISALESPQNHSNFVCQKICADQCDLLKRLVFSFKYRPHWSTKCEKIFWQYFIGHLRVFSRVFEVADHEYDIGFFRLALVYEIQHVQNVKIGIFDMLYLKNRSQSKKKLLSYSCSVTSKTLENTLR